MKFISKKVKQHAVREYLSGKKATALTQELFPHENISNYRRYLYKWVHKYAPYARPKRQILSRKQAMKSKYSMTLKLSYVRRYLAGESALALAKEMWPSRNPYSNRSFVKTWQKTLEHHRIIPPGLTRLRLKKMLNYKKLTKSELIAIIETLQKYQAQAMTKKLSRFQFIAANKPKILTTKMLCAVLNVSRAGFYKHQKQGQASNTNEHLAILVKMLFYKHKTNIGYRKMVHYVKRVTQVKYNHKRIYRIMKNNNLQASIRTKYAKTLANELEQFPYLLNRDFTSSQPLQKLVTDVTIIRLSDFTNAYLSPVMDLFNRKILSYEFKRTNDPQLIVPQLVKLAKMTNNCKPIINSDHGSIYFSGAYQAIASRYFRISMSRIGNCLDNQPIEYFFSIIKQECIKRISFQERNFTKLKLAIKSFVKYYNEERIQSYLKYQTPSEYK